MDKKNCERLFETPEHSTNKSDGSKWRELPISNCREIKGIPYSETESFAETVQEARTKKEFPSTYVKSYSHNTKQPIKSFMARVSVAMPPSKLPNITKKNVTEIKFTVAEKRAEKMMIFQGPCYRIRKNGIERPLHILSESSTLIESQSFNIIILVVKREFGIIFLDFYGKVFELNKMSDGPLGNYLKEVTTKPWTGEVAWDIDDDRVIFEFKYYTEAECTAHDFIYQDYPKTQKLEKKQEKQEKQHDFLIS
ncbi:unnamed protein product [Rhizophagus irregularis]|nr:unnamed protein product [Rhizophagus irregularis]CAB5315492.1 unnamed protein product [Rhizophagus irregularis]